MGWLGLTWDTVFKQCANVEAAGRVLLSNFRSAKTGRTPQEALRVALSMYNTGSQSRGFRNGYEIGREHVSTPVTNPPLGCRLRHEKKITPSILTHIPHA